MLHVRILHVPKLFIKKILTLFATAYLCIVPLLFAQIFAAQFRSFDSLIELSDLTIFRWEDKVNFGFIATFKEYTIANVLSHILIDVDDKNYECKFEDQLIQMSPIVLPKEQVIVVKTGFYDCIDEIAQAYPNEIAAAAVKMAVYVDVRGPWGVRWIKRYNTALTGAELQ